MKTLLIILLALVLSGCVKATYTAKEDEGEKFTLWSFFKSVDGLDTEKSDGKFSLKMDKTHTTDPSANMLEMMKLMYGIKPVNPPEGNN